MWERLSKGKSGTLIPFDSCNYNVLTNLLNLFCFTLRDVLNCGEIIPSFPWWIQVNLELIEKHQVYSECGISFKMFYFAQGLCLGWAVLCN